MKSAHSMRRRRSGYLHPVCGRTHHGAALIVALLMLTAVMMLSTSAVQIALQEHKASRNGRDRLIALQAAEAALDDAVQDIERSHRRHIFVDDDPDRMAYGCDGGQSGLYRGVCVNPAAEREHVWQLPDFVGDAQSLSVPYGHFTERQFPSGAGMLSARPPRYVIEVMARDGDALSEQERSLQHVFRITAVGFGVRDATRVVVQSFYRKSDAGAQATVPARLSGWREIVNWEELSNARAEK